MVNINTCKKLKKQDHNKNARRKTIYHYRQPAPAAGGAQERELNKW